LGGGLLSSTALGDAQPPKGSGSVEVHGRIVLRDINGASYEGKKEKVIP